MKKARIFIVEDEALIAMELKDRLMSMGYEVSGTAARGAEALAAITETKTDLVLMDIRLSGPMSGIELSTTLQQTAGIPVIYVSAYSDQSLIDQAAASGAYGFLLKPFTERELRAAVEVALVKRRLEQKLHTTEQRYQKLFERAGDAIFILESMGENAGRIVDANPAAAEMHGYSVEELKRLTIQDLDAPGAASEAGALIERMARGEWIKKEIMHRRKDGSVFPVEISAGVLEIDGHRYILAFDRDITDRRRLEESLLQSEKKYRDLFESANDALFILDLKGNFIDANRTAYTRLGYTKEELISRHISALDPPDFAARVPQRMADLQAHGSAVFESAHVRKDGTIMPVEINARIVDYEGRKVCLSVIRDITERKRADAEREKFIGDLNRSRQEWQDTFDGITDLVYIIDADFTVLRANRAFSERNGLKPSEVTGRKCFSLLCSPREPSAECPHVRALREDRAVTAEMSLQDGRKMLISSYPHHSPEGARGSINVARDITEVKAAEMRLIMSERLASLGQMAAGLAHEINNPLASIAGCAEMLLEKVRKGAWDAKRFDEYITIIAEEVQRSKNITSSMLSFVRKSSFEQKEIDLSQALEKTLEIIGFQGRLRNVRIVRNYGRDLPRFTGSEGDVRQVLIVIISNALDAMNEYGTLTVTTGADAGTVYVKIADTGPGIEPENLEKIFAPFFTTKTGQDGSGTGLGLSIAENIVSGLNGSIKVASERGSGCEFTIMLPATGSPDAPLIQPDGSGSSEAD